MPQPYTDSESAALDAMEAEFEQANIRIGEATWNIYSGEGEADLDEAHRPMASLLCHESNRSLVERLRNTVDPGQDPLLFRRLSIWERCCTSSAIDNAPEVSAIKNRLQQRIADFKPEIEGKKIPRSEAQRILRQDPDRENRHRAWKSLAPLGAANRTDLHRLIELRNRKARDLGYRDYVDLAFKLQEIDEGMLHGVLDQLTHKAQARYSALIAFLAEELGVWQLAPWDVPYAMRRHFQSPEAYFPADQGLDRLRLTAGSLGFPVDSLPIRTVVRDIPFGGYNVAVRIPSDSRFLVNPSEGHAFYTTAFHEYGHSLQAVYTATQWPILKEYEWVMGAHTAAYSEGMAEVMGDFARRADWLSATAGLPDRETEDYTTRILPAQMIVRLFELLLNMRIELAAYQANFQEMAALERQLTREVRLLEPREDDPALWEANTWYTSYPVYWQNYILASVISSQVHDSITARFGLNAGSNPNVAKYLQENFYAPGNQLPWTERILRGTGKPLDVEPYLRRMLVPAA